MAAELTCQQSDWHLNNGRMDNCPNPDCEQHVSFCFNSDSGSLSKTIKCTQGHHMLSHLHPVHHIWMCFTVLRPDSWWHPGGIFNACMYLSMLCGWNITSVREWLWIYALAVSQHCVRSQYLSISWKMLSTRNATTSILMIEGLKLNQMRRKPQNRNNFALPCYLIWLNYTSMRVYYTLYNAEVNVMHWNVVQCAYICISDISVLSVLQKWLITV